MLLPFLNPIISANVSVPSDVATEQIDPRFAGNPSHSKKWPSYLLTRPEVVYLPDNAMLLIASVIESELFSFIINL